MQEAVSADVKLTEVIWPADSPYPIFLIDIDIERCECSAIGSGADNPVVRDRWGLGQFSRAPMAHTDEELPDPNRSPIGSVNGSSASLSSSRTGRGSTLLAPVRMAAWLVIPLRLGSWQQRLDQ
jgi:hypothetical protein